jgi:ribosome maturation factor RimP
VSRGYTQATFSRTRTLLIGGPGPTFFSAYRGAEEGRETPTKRQSLSAHSELAGTIERRIEAVDPRIELIMLEQPAAEALRLYIDHPDGVDLALCERVTNQLRDLLTDWSLEVSSPGADRPLTKPEHFRRFLGRQVKVRTSEAISGRRNFTGTLTAADDESVSLESDGGAVRIPMAGIRRSNLVPEFGRGGAAA